MGTETRFRPTRSFPLQEVWGHVKESGKRIQPAKTDSGGVGQGLTAIQALPSPAPPSLPIALFALEHTPQSQTAGEAAKPLARMLVSDGEGDITAGSIAHPFAKMFAGRGWALTLGGVSRGRDRGGGCSCLSLLASLSISLMLLAALLSAVVGGAITATGLDAPPAPGCFLTGVAAITSLRMGGVKPAFTVFQKTTTGGTVLKGLWSWTRKMMK